jgi:hypothetical protein
MLSRGPPLISRCLCSLRWHDGLVLLLPESHTAGVRGSSTVLDRAQKIAEPVTSVKPPRPATWICTTLVCRVPVDRGFSRDETVTEVG